MLRRFCMAKWCLFVVAILPWRCDSSPFLLVCFSLTEINRYYCMHDCTRKVFLLYEQNFQSMTRQNGRSYLVTAKFRDVEGGTPWEGQTCWTRKSWKYWAVVTVEHAKVKIENTVLWSGHGVEQKRWQKACACRRAKIVVAHFASRCSKLDQGAPVYIK
jgi:hypothetical protein